MTRLLRCLPFAIVLAVWACVAAPEARADCARVDTEIAASEQALTAAEPSRDGTQADFERRLGLVQSGYAHADAAETERSTTPGGCGNIQQVYRVLLDHAWADTLLAYLKPTLEFYVGDSDCKALSRLQTQEIVLEAYETMNRSLISWNPFDDRAIAARDHVTRLVASAAAYSRIGLPKVEQAEDFARQYHYQVAALRAKASVDCTKTVTDDRIPGAIVTRVFAPSTSEAVR